MMKFTKIFMALPLLLTILLVGCSLDNPDENQDLVVIPADQVVQNYAAMGNSLTAGFQDGGLCINGQLASYPYMIAKQIGLDVSIGNSDFTQPYIALPGIGSTGSADPAIVNGVLHFDGSSISVLGTHQYADIIDATSPANPLMLRTLPTPYSNHGVPGATLRDGMHAFDAASSEDGVAYFNFINRPTLYGNTSIPAVAGVHGGYESSSMFGQTVAMASTLTTLWLGNNDILGGATGGNPVIGENITDAASFQAEYTMLLSTMAGGLARVTQTKPTIIVANIPSISTIPFFMTKGTFQAALPEALGGDWPWGYDDGNDDDGMLLTFPVLSWIAVPANQGTPIPSYYTLTTAEVITVETQVATFNGIIAGVANAVDESGYATVGLVDANALMVEIHSGTHAAGPYAATHFMFLLGAGMTVEQASAATLFSLDGIHPNSRGYGVVANAFIEKINELQGTEIAPVDWSALVWDPTYGASIDRETMSGPMPTLDNEAAHAMSAIFR